VVSFKRAPTGSPKKHKVSGQANIYITQFRCSECGAKWALEEDKNDDYSGWSKVI
jgi:hypothetical protein